MREALYPSCSLERSRSEYRAEGLDRPVYIGLGVGRRIHQTPGQSATANSHWSVGYHGFMADMGSLSCGPEWVIPTGTRELAGTNER